jgi:AGZA family xanthine/uracil permease-like MFS transporter
MASVVPACATAPALIAVGFLMCGSLARIDFGEPGTAIPAFIIVLLIPLTYSIAHGIGFGAVAYVAIAALRGRVRDVPPVMYGVAAAFIAYFVLA